MTCNVLRAASYGLILTAAGTLSAAPDAVQPIDTPPITDTITLWLSANFDLPVPEQPPRLATLPASDLVSMRYGPEARIEPGQVVAVYDDAAETIYLSQGWTGRTPAELSVLVHELVHHLQSSANQSFSCPAERERVAYQAQGAWLALFDESLVTAFDIDAATLLVSTVCIN
jgi:hypothetical protein